MTRERANELKEVFNAFCEGKKIQFYDGVNWITIISNEPLWEDGVKYRIKPTEEYRPYESTDEMIDDYVTMYELGIFAHTLPKIWVKHKTSGCRQLIIGFCKDDVELSDCWVDMQDLFDDYEYLDGTKIGKKVE